MNGEMVYTAIGLSQTQSRFSYLCTNKCTHVATFALSNKSLTLPPATLRKADPHSPVRNRKTRYVSAGSQFAVEPGFGVKLYRFCVPIFGGNAVGNVRAKKQTYDTR